MTAADWGTLVPAVAALIWAAAAYVRAQAAHKRINDMQAGQGSGPAGSFTNATTDPSGNPVNPVLSTCTQPGGGYVNLAGNTVTMGANRFWQGDTDQ